MEDAVLKVVPVVSSANNQLDFRFPFCIQLMMQIRLVINYSISDWKSCALDIKCAAKTLRSYYNAFAQVIEIEISFTTIVFFPN